MYHCNAIVLCIMKFDLVHFCIKTTLSTCMSLLRVLLNRLSHHTEFLKSNIIKNAICQNIRTLLTSRSSFNKILITIEAPNKVNI